ncbi:oxygen-independent coproporphyrinogen III oxidase [Leptolyngbya ohadii]|uniref:oxygen-independent coproporphyrinogen III oxidase n=1 Tax=Leptolyngbya ohadii TaxID=1962290 RepID=UPI000B5A07E6|nr:oxygen-independent coproporphyrinogen III oxidase [Leptolyngbya ohadii]
MQFSNSVQFNAPLLQKYDRPLPRYTSYPPASELDPRFNVQEYSQLIAASNQRNFPLSLYFHIPFCQTACYFCGCNVIVSGNKNIAATYLDYLKREIEQTAQHINTRRPVVQLHWGGGTPNYLTHDQVEQLWQTIRQYFHFAPNAEISVEVNPRYIDTDYIQMLRSVGFNRISFGIQDFNPKVQQAVNRIQPTEMLFDRMAAIRATQFESVNVDLIYGLPYQTLETFTDTIEKTIALNPDRIAVFNFAYVPQFKAVQKNIPIEALPSTADKMAMLQMTIETLGKGGYQYIGMDHFAKPTDELAIAQVNGTLKRNFQGYTTLPEADLFAFGLTSISMLHDAYIQNQKHLSDYYRAIDAGEFPIERGIKLSADDLIRRDVIMELMCEFRLTKTAIESKHGINYDRYFQSEQWDLKALEADGLLQLHPEGIQVTPAGRLLIRNIAAIFDTHLRRSTFSSFSKAI